MSSNIKYLSFGLIIGIVIGAVVIAAVFFSTSAGATSPPTTTPTVVRPSSTPTQTPLPTSTFTPTPTLIPLASATTTAESVEATTQPADNIASMIQAGELFFVGPLAIEQQIALYQTSLNYIAPTAQDSLELAKAINGVSYGNPSNTCGPLSIVILQGAGLISAEVNPHNYWLLNPWLPDDRAVLDRTFPSERYDHFTFHVWLRNFAWEAFPLEPGDFLYIHAGGGGNFDHMLVVNRVDQDARAYSVTNYNTPDGFLINEVMLYDPNDRTAGIFHTWTKDQNAILGSTGFGGFEVWRLRTP